MEDTAAAFAAAPACSPTNPFAELTSVATPQRHSEQPWPPVGGFDLEATSIEFNELTNLRARLTRFQTSVKKMEDNDQILLQKRGELVATENESAAVLDEYVAELEIQLERAIKEKKQLELELEESKKENAAKDSKLAELERENGMALAAKDSELAELERKNGMALAAKDREISRLNAKLNELDRLLSQL